MTRTTHEALRRPLMAGSKTPSRPRRKPASRTPTGARLAPEPDPVALRLAQLAKAYEAYDRACEQTWEKCRRTQQDAWETARGEMDSHARIWQATVAEIRGRDDQQEAAG
jgi:hypothetical protein